MSIAKNTILYTKKLVKVDLILGVFMVIIIIINKKERRRELLEVMNMFKTQIVVMVSWVYTYL